MQKKLKPALALASLGVLALVVSGCWAFSGINYSKVQLQPGPTKKSTSTVKVWGHPTDTNTKEYFFIFTAVGDESGLTFKNRGRFDLTKKFGNKPKDLVPNATILSEIVDDDEACGEFELSTFEDPISEGEYKVLATAREIPNDGAFARQVVSSIKVKQDSPSVVGDNGPQDLPDIASDVLVSVGSWEDEDNDEVIDNSDTFSCSGGSITVLETKFAN